MGKKKHNRLIEKIHHQMNSLHLYCKLTRIMRKSYAMKIAQLYERSPLYWFLYFVV